jgi:hypothetical protein
MTLLTVTTESATEPLLLQAPRPCVKEGREGGVGGCGRRGAKVSAAVRPRFVIMGLAWLWTRLSTAKLRWLWPVLVPLLASQKSHPSFVVSAGSLSPRAVTVAEPSSHCTARGASIEVCEGRMDIIAAYRE